MDNFLLYYTSLKERDIAIRNADKIRSIAKLKNTLENKISDSQLNKCLIQILII